MPITELLHVSLIVSDLQRSLTFYCNTLGFSQIDRPELNFPGSWLSVGSQQIHLLALDNPDPVTDRPAHPGRDRHIAFAVDSLQEMKRSLERDLISYTASQSGRAALFFRDPDGNGLEVIQLEVDSIVYPQPLQDDSEKTDSEKKKKNGFFMDEIVNAYIYNEGASHGESHALVCLELNKIIFCSELYDGCVDENENLHNPDQCIPLPHKNELDLGKRLVFSFIREMYPDDVNRVERMFSRRGAYRRFKTFLQEREILDLWYDYENSVQEAALRSWCEWNDILLKD